MGRDSFCGLSGPLRIIESLLRAADEIPRVTEIRQEFRDHWRVEIWPFSLLWLFSSSTTEQAVIQIYVLIFSLI